MTEFPNARLTLSNRPENVLLVRQMLIGLGELVGLGRPGLNDVVTAATEACNNVVLHAYGEDEGPLEVEAHVQPRRLGLVVRDRGAGMAPDGHADGEPSDGIGLSVIETLTASSELRLEQGVEVHMSFEIPEVEPMSAPSEAPPLLRQIARCELAATVAIEAAPSVLASALLPRVLSTLAARAHFPVEAIADVRRIAERLVAQWATEAYIGAAASVTQRALFLRWGPFPQGTEDSVLERTAQARSAALAIALAEPTIAAGPSELLELRLEPHA